MSFESKNQVLLCLVWKYSNNKRQKRSRLEVRPLQSFYCCTSSVVMATVLLACELSGCNDFILSTFQTSHPGLKRRTSLSESP